MSTHSFRCWLLAWILAVSFSSAQVSYQYIHCYDQGGYRTAVCPSGYLLTSCNGGVIDQANGNRCVPYSDHESPVLYARCCNLTGASDSSYDAMHTQYAIVNHPNVNNSIYCQSSQQQMVGCTSSTFIGLYVNKQAYNAAEKSTLLTCAINHNAPNTSVVYASARCYDTQSVENDGYQLNCHAVWGKSTQVQCPAHHFLTSCHAYSSNPSAVEWYGVNDTTQTCIATPTETNAASTSDYVVTANAICCASSKSIVAQSITNGDSFIVQQSAIIISTLVSCCVMCALISLSVFVCQRKRHRERLDTDADADRRISESGITDLPPTDFLKTNPRTVPMSTTDLQNMQAREGLSDYHASENLMQASVQNHISQTSEVQDDGDAPVHKRDETDTIVIRIARQQK